MEWEPTNVNAILATQEKPVMQKLTGVIQALVTMVIVLKVNMDTDASV